MEDMDWDDCCEWGDNNSTNLSDFSMEVEDEECENMEREECDDPYRVL